MFDPTATPTGTYRPGKKRDAQLNRILEAAQEEFSLHGYGGASVQAIADRAGLPKSNVQYYFKRKANLYVSVLNEIVELWNSSLSAIDPDDDPAVALDRFIREKTRLAFAHPRSSRLFAMEIVGGAPHLADYIATDMRRWVNQRAAVIQSWIDAGRMSPVDPVQFIFLVWSSTQHYADFEAQTLLLLKRRKYSEDTIEKVTGFLATTLLRGVGLEPPQHSSSRATKGTPRASGRRNGSASRSQASAVKGSKAPVAKRPRAKDSTQKRPRRRS